MHDKYEYLHEVILMILHELTFGELGLKGDVNERLLTSWYESKKPLVEEKVESIIAGAPTLR